MVRASIAAVNPTAAIVEARSSLSLVGGDVAGKRVAVVEDGPTLTHGGMTYGAGIVAARRFHAAATACSYFNPMLLTRMYVMPMAVLNPR